MVAQAKKPRFKKARRRWRRWKFRLIVTALIGIFLTIYFWNNIFIPIFPGEIGVRWVRLGGGTSEKIYGEGYHAIYPWDIMYRYNVRIQELRDQIDLLTSDGLLIRMTVSTRFFPKVETLPTLHQRVGQEYIQKLVRPEVISALRRVIGNYTPQEIYSRDEQGLLEEIRVEVMAQVGENYVNFHDILILELLLPDPLQTAINDKLAKEQQALAHDFIIERERKEKERRRIEAEGIKLFSSISGVNILNWRGIEATEALAASDNAKVVIIGTDSKSLPVILNTGK